MVPSVAVPMLTAGTPMWTRAVVKVVLPARLDAETVASVLRRNPDMKSFIHGFGTQKKWNDSTAFMRAFCRK